MGRFCCSKDKIVAGGTRRRLVKAWPGWSRPCGARRPVPTPYRRPSLPSTRRGWRAEETGWAQIAALYGVLLRLQPSAVVELNRAVAVAMSQGAEAGLRLLQEL